MDVVIPYIIPNIPYIIPKDMGMFRFFRLEARKISTTRGDVASAAAGGSGIAGGRVLPEGWSSWRVFKSRGRGIEQISMFGFRFIFI